jgi:hypothetical protein
MGFDVDKALREAQESEQHLSAAEQLERRQEEFERALDPVRRLNEHLLEATRSLGGVETLERFLEQQRRQYRELARGVAWSNPVEHLMEQFKQSIVAISDAPALDVSRQVQEAFAAYDFQIVDSSRRILEAMHAQMVSVRFPQVETLRPTLNPVVARVPYRPQPAPDPVVEVDVAPIPQPQAPEREQDPIEQFAIEVAKAVVSTLLVTAIVWYMRTGIWVFEELLAYYIKLLE